MERPLFNEHPSELGAKGNEEMILKRLQSDPVYQKLFAAAFPAKKDPVRFSDLIRSIAAFLGSLQSFNAPYDRFIQGDTGALSMSAKAGMKLFFSEDLQCASCHTPPLFTLATKTKNTDSIFINTGLYNVSNTNRYPGADKGLAAISCRTDDDGKFKIPALRNVSLTAPYMHDGSINTLEEVIAVYANGGRNIIAGPNTGDGKNNTLKDKRISGFSVSAVEKKQLIDFLFSLADSSVLTNPAFQNPFNLSNK